MALFGKKTEEKEENKNDVLRQKDVREKKNPSDASIKENADINSYNVLIEPWVTEKAHEKMSMNKYIFRVGDNSVKNSIKKAIEKLYNVSVIKVNIVNIPKKKRVSGRHIGWKAGYKKAIVTLKEGNKIELFKGV